VRNPPAVVGATAVAVLGLLAAGCGCGQTGQTQGGRDTPVDAERVAEVLAPHLVPEVVRPVMVEVAPLIVASVAGLSAPGAGPPGLATWCADAGWRGWFVRDVDPRFRVTMPLPLDWRPVSATRD
jgi:hypothetical protein